MDARRHARCCCSALASIGRETCQANGREGSQVASQDGGIVGASNRSEAECYAQNVAATTWFAQKFVSRLEHTPLCVAHCQVLETKAPGHNKIPSWPQCFIMEPFLRGVFVKFNNNSGYVQKAHAASDVAQAFSHFSYHESEGRMLVVDVQGIYSEGKLTISDPQVLSTDCSFGRGDMGREGMAHFFASHQCGDLCRKLGLPPVQLAPPAPAPISIPQVPGKSCDHVQEDCTEDMTDGSCSEEQVSVDQRNHDIQPDTDERPASDTDEHEDALKMRDDTCAQRSQSSSRAPALVCIPTSQTQTDDTSHPLTCSHQ